MRFRLLRMQMQRLVEYYNMSSVSFRNAYFPYIDREVPGYEVHDLFLRDLVHPTKLGVELLADMVSLYVTKESAMAPLLWDVEGMLHV